MSNEINLNGAQIKRLETIYGAAAELCAALVNDIESEDADFDMDIVGEIADFATSILSENGFRVNYPVIVTDKDGNQRVAEYYSE